MRKNILSGALLLGLVSGVVSTEARGDIVVSIESKTVAPGAPVSIEVTFYSTDPGNDFLDAYSVRFMIEKSESGVPPTGLMYFDASQYTAPPNGDGPNDPISPYIYGATADTQAVSLDPGPTPMVLDASDSADNAGVSAPEVPSTPIGLIRLMLTTGGIVATQPGDVYKISLVADDSTFLDFTKPDSTIPFTSNVGTITVSAVPEPGTFGLAGVGLVMGVGLWRRRRGR